MNWLSTKAHASSSITELLLGGECPVSNYISKTPLYLCVITYLIFIIMRRKLSLYFICLFHFFYFLLAFTLTYDELDILKNSPLI